MSIKFHCSCGKKLKADEDKAGRKIICSGCGNTIVVPSASEEGSGPPPTAKPAPAKSAPADPKSSRNTAADAIAQMKKAAEANKKHSLTDDDDELQDERESRGIDYAGLGKALATKGLPALIGIIVVAYGLYYMAFKVMVGGPKLPPLAAVSGVLRIQGQPVPLAVIVFNPSEAEQPGSKLQASSSTAVTDKDGKYTLSYTTTVPGAFIGKHRIDIQATSPNGENLIPPESRGKPIFLDVKAGSNTLDIDIPPK